MFVAPPGVGETVVGANLVAGYGHVIVDECHHVPAVSFERAMREVRARLTSLTTTGRGTRVPRGAGGRSSRCNRAGRRHGLERSSEQGSERVPGGESRIGWDLAVAGVVMPSTDQEILEALVREKLGLGSDAGPIAERLSLHRRVEMAFSIGDSVKVRAGVKSPDDDPLSIAGWQGRLSDIDEDEETVGVRWDSITLDELPAGFIKHSEIEGLDWAEMYLDVDEIELAAWAKHLSRTLSFPFDAKVSEYLDRGPLERGSRVSVQGLDEADESYRVWFANR